MTATHSLYLFTQKSEMTAGIGIKVENDTQRIEVVSTEEYGTMMRGKKADQLIEDAEYATKF
ncbi:hypothetical protein [Bacillus cereus group sp. TH260-2LC]|uniref:hypothetical protein n=1 Tax=unclassified Bacillus cereus group TaxID=2750818 RepID=UPI0022E24A61|nr:hypothetical protein [Bacillus cereus group sp. TH260-2LC]MDA1527243.1 hypothetical protein [Bacillus cereus group sp. TH260-2LC]